MDDIRLLNSEDKCIIANKDKEKKKNALIRVRPMVSKSFDHLLNEFNFYARKQNASRVFAIVWASVCPSVCPSVTLVICIKTVQAKITKSSMWLPQGL